MLVETDDLVTVVDIAGRLDVHVSTVQHWQREEVTFPEPVAVIGGKTRVWAWPDVAAWAHGWGFDVEVIERRHQQGKPPRVMPAADIAELRHWNRPSTVRSMWKQSNSFPAPIRKIGKAWVWDYEEIMRWHRSHPMRRRKGVSPNQ